MYSALIDTCSWFEIGINTNAHLLLDQMESFLNDRRLTLLVPDQVVDEFARHKADNAQRIRKRELNHLNGASEYLSCNSQIESSESALLALGEAKRLLESDSEKIAKSLDRIELLFSHHTTQRLKRDSSIDSRVVSRGLAKLAPFVTSKQDGKQQRNKNSVADAMLFEMFVGAVKHRSSLANKFIFSSINTNDFSDANDTTLPHPDIKDVFESQRDVFFIPNFADALNTIGAAAIPQPVVREVGSVIELYNQRPRCSFCGGTSLMPCSATGRDHDGKTLYYLFCRECGQQTDVREAWGDD